MQSLSMVPTVSRDQQDQVPVFRGDELTGKFTSKAFSGKYKYNITLSI